MNNIKNNILIFGFSVLIAGCSQSATSVFNKDPLYGQNLQYSKVIKSIEKENVNAIINITYLNSVNPLQWDNNKQNFLIATYVFENNEKDFHLTMNEQKQISSKLIQKNDPLYKNIAFENKWAEYKLITFDNIEDDDLTIQYTHPKFKTISTQFIKE